LIVADLIAHSNFTADRSKNSQIPPQENPGSVATPITAEYFNPNQMSINKFSLFHFNGLKCQQRHRQALRLRLTWWHITQAYKQ